MINYIYVLLFDFTKDIPNFELIYCRYFLLYIIIFQFIFEFIHKVKKEGIIPKLIKNSILFILITTSIFYALGTVIVNFFQFKKFPEWWLSCLFFIGMGDNSWKSPHHK